MVRLKTGTRLSWPICHGSFIWSVVLMQTFPPGRSGKWRTWYEVRTLFLSPSKIGSFFGCFFYFIFSVSTNSIFEYLNNALFSFFFNPFLSLDFSLLLCAVFSYAGAFNGDLSAWRVGELMTMNGSTYTLSLPLHQVGGFFGCFYFPFFFLWQHWFYFWTQCSLLLFLQPHFLSLNFSLLLLWCSVSKCWCLQWWSLDLAGRGSDDHGIQYVHSFLPPLWLLLFSHLLSVAALILFLNTMLSPLFFNIFILGLFLVAALVQCFWVLVPSMVISPHGRSEKWRAWVTVCTVFFFPLQVAFALILFFFFQPIFILGLFICCCGTCTVFQAAVAFNGNLSTWQVGEVTTMAYSTYTLSPPFTSFFGCFYIPFFFLWQH